MERTTVEIPAITYDPVELFMEQDAERLDALIAETERQDMEQLTAWMEIITAPGFTALKFTQRINYPMVKRESKGSSSASLSLVAVFGPTPYPCSARTMLLCGTPATLPNSTFVSPLITRARANASLFGTILVRFCTKSLLKFNSR